MKLFWSIILCFVLTTSNAKDIFVDVLSNYKVKKIQLEFPQGQYTINLDDQDLLRVTSKDIILIYSISNKISLFKNAKLIGTYKQIYISTDDIDAHIKVQIFSPKQKIFFYQDQLYIRTLSARFRVNSKNISSYHNMW